MSAISDTIDDAVDHAFELHGEDATYTPSGGSGVSIKVIPRQPDEISGLEGADIQRQVNLFDVRVSEVATVSDSGDTLTVGSTTYEVAHARRRDPRRKIWTLEGREQ